MKKKIELTTNGKAMLVTAPVSLVVFEMLAHGGTIGFALAAASTFVAARHASDIKHTGARLLQGLIRSEKGDGRNLPSDEETEADRKTHRRYPDSREHSKRSWEAEEYDEESLDTLDDDDEIEFFSEGSHKRITLFSELLKTGWRPSMEQIYVGTSEHGRHLFVPVRKLWHVALAGATGHGKSSLMRLLMAQLCYLKLPVILLNPHYMIYDYDHKEDWTPYTPYLKSDPMKCKNMATIAKALKWMAGELLETRKERASQGVSAGKPIFYILDEYPDIKAEVKEAPGYVGKLLRQGRKYNIYLIVASQDYSVKTIGVEGEGAIRKCFRTVFYVGGDPISVKELLNKAAKDIPENELGQGTIMLKCATVEDPIVVHVPYLDNKSLYILLGPTTYAEPEEMLEEETAVSQEDMAAGIDDMQTEVPGEPTVKPNMPEKGRKAEEIDPKMAVEIWNAGYNSKRKLMMVFGITDHQALKLMEIIGVKEK
jgi:Helicase HerA, central domain